MKIVAISDLHGQLPDPATMPRGDLFFIAGDICPDRPAGGLTQRQWYEGVFLPWVEAVGIDAFATWGNHDRLEGSDSFMKVDELNDYLVKTWFSPWCQNLPRWAWNLTTESLVGVYAKIPEGTQVIVSHQPPFGYGDQVPGYLIGPTEDPDGHVGSKELLATIDRVRPDVVICGHIHEGHGAYRHVRPDGGTTHIYNVSYVDGAYRPSHPATVIEI